MSDTADSIRNKERIGAPAKQALGVERAKKLAIALSVHPAVLLFPQWQGKKTQVS